MRITFFSTLVLYFKNAGMGVLVLVILASGCGNVFGNIAGNEAGNSYGKGFLINVGNVYGESNKANSVPAQPDTIILKMKNGEKMIIVTEKGKKRIVQLREVDVNKVLESVDSVLKGQQFGEIETGLAFQKDTNVVINRMEGDGSRGEKQTIRINTKKGVTVITTQINRDEDDMDTVITSVKKKRKRFGTSSFYLNLGLNNYYKGNGKAPNSADAFQLRPLGSRYVALGYAYYVPFTRKDKAGASLGLEFAWNNFMFERSFKALEGQNAVEFAPITGPPITDVYKSKLVLAALKVPLMLRVKLGGPWAFNAGGFVGYRLDSYTKLKFKENGDTRKVRTHDSYYLSSFLYGLKAQLNYGDIGFFGEVNLNPLFSKGNGPELQTFSFGISL
jgi:hypothetical protein